MAKKKINELHCSFCGRTESQGATILPSPAENAGICIDCLETAATMLGMIEEPDDSNGAAMRARAKHRHSHGPEEHEHNAAKKIPTPAEIKEYLDQYIIGQDLDMIYLSVAV